MSLIYSNSGLFIWGSNEGHTSNRGSRVCRKHHQAAGCHQVWGGGSPRSQEFGWPMSSRRPRHRDQSWLSAVQGKLNLNWAFVAQRLHMIHINWLPHPSPNLDLGVCVILISIYKICKLSWHISPSFFLFEYSVFICVSYLPTGGSVWRGLPEIHQCPAGGRLPTPLVL